MSESDSEIIPPWVTRTQQTLGQLIDRPRLSAPLLMRPPFRFIHDIVVRLIEVTGFMEDVYGEDERSSESFTDKRSKIVFLEKLIFSVSEELGLRELEVSPNKIVAGLDPEKTNRLLVSLHDAATLRVERNSKGLPGMPGSGKCAPKVDAFNFIESIESIARISVDIGESILPEIKKHWHQQDIDFAAKRQDILRILDSMEPT